MLQQVSALHSFLCLNNVLLYGYITMCLFIHYLIDICGVSTLWLLWIVLVWICGFSSTCIYLNNYSQFVEVWYEGVELWGYIIILSLSFCSVQFSRSVVFNSLPPHEPQHTRPPCPSSTPRVHSCPSSWWCYQAISSSVVPFSSCPQSFPASGSFPMSKLFASGGQSIGVSASTSVLLMNTKDWFPLGWTGWISLQSRGLSRVFSNTTVQKHQFFGAQLSSQSNSHIHTWPL